jgi:benzoyl-CoA-dihydrodiol lyase
VQWRLVDEVVPPSSWQRAVAQRAQEFAARSDRPRNARGILLTPLQRRFEDAAVIYTQVKVDLDREARRATITVRGPDTPAPPSSEAAHTGGAVFWPLTVARELDDAILHLRLNEPELGLWVLRTEGDADAVLTYDALLEVNQSDWLLCEVRHYLKRVLKRLDVTSRSLIALIEPGSCFAGTLAELAFAADRAVMLIGARDGDNRPAAAIKLGWANFGAYPMGNGLSRLATRFLGEPETLAAAQARSGEALDAEAAEVLGLVTLAYDATDWDDEVRIMLEERASFSPDALTGMEANLRFAGPETMETRIFGRLTAWQNWIFQRPNAVGEQGALKRYGSGVQPTYDRARV